MSFYKPVWLSSVKCFGVCVCQYNDVNGHQNRYQHSSKYLLSRSTEEDHTCLKGLKGE